MKLVNPDLINQINYQQTGVCLGLFAYTDAIINTILNTCSGLNATKEYWLYYFIKEDYRANILSLQGMNIDADIFGFPIIKKNLRHMIETLIDLFNLVNDEGYIEVMKHCAHERNTVENTKYSRYLYNHSFTIKSKMKIAEEINSYSFNQYYDIVKEGNKYVHPNVFIDVASKQVNHVSDLQKLLLINLEIFLMGFELFRDKYWSSVRLNCFECPNLNNCSLCYEKEKSVVRDIILNRLVWTPGVFNNGYL